MRDQAFLDGFAGQLDKALKRNGIGPSEAARRIGVARQLVHQYLKAEKTPAADTLLRLCVLLAMEIEYRGVTFSASAFRQNGNGPQVVHIQQSLFDEPQVLRNGPLEVKIGARRDGNIELTLEVRSA